MGTQRFPRAKFLRSLLRIETELHSWATILKQRNVEAGVAVDDGGWDDRCNALWVTSQDIHSIADDLAHLPGAAQRRVRRETRKK